MYRASLEGVAFSFVYGVNLLKKMGLAVDVIRVGNDNMFQSKVFSMTISTLLGCKIEVVETTGAIGAARAAGVASGIYRNIKEAMQDVKPCHVFEPRLDFAMCTQAYNYWVSILKRTLSKPSENSSLIDRLKEENDQLKKELREKNKRITSQSIELDAQKDLLKSLSNSMTRLKENIEESEVIAEVKKVQRSIRSIEKNEDCLL